MLFDAYWPFRKYRSNLQAQRRGARPFGDEVISFDHVVLVIAVVASSPVLRTLIISIVAAHLARTSDDPKVLNRFAEVVRAMRRGKS